MATMSASSAVRPDIAQDRPFEPAVHRQGWIDVAKGIGIILVVYGHALGGLAAAGLISAESAPFYAIYTFHMPLFFFLSGMFVPKRLARDRLRFVQRLLPTIIYPYLLWSIIQVTIIYLAVDYVNVSRPHLAFATIFWAPPSQFWFLYVLLIFHLLAAGLAAVRMLPAIGLLGLAAAIFGYVLPARWEPLREIDAFLLFYAAGVAFGSRGEMLRDLLERHAWALAGAAGMVWAFCVGWGWTSGLEPWTVPMIPAAIAGVLATLSVSVALSSRVALWLRYVGERALAIYVLHVLFVAGTRIVLARLIGFQNGPAMQPLLVIAGITGPLLIFALAARVGRPEWFGLGNAVRRQATAHG